MQLYAFGGARDSAAVGVALAAAQIDAVLYEDVNDPEGVAVLTLSESQDAFVTTTRTLFTSAPFGELRPTPDLTIMEREYALGHEEDHEETPGNRSARPRPDP